MPNKIGFDIKLINDKMYIHDVSIMLKSDHFSVNNAKLELTYGTALTPAVVIDVVDYLLHSRESFEIGKILPADLGHGSKFKDGFYKIKYTFGNFVKENKFVIFANAFDEYNKLLEELYREVNVVNIYSLQYTTKEVSGVTEQLAIANSMFDILKTKTDLTAVDAHKILDKVNRILSIVNNNNN